MTQSTAVEAANRPTFPWYDSAWLTKYTRAREIIRRARPAALADFTTAFQVFHTRPDLEPALIRNAFDDDLASVKRTVASLKLTDLELHEARMFGRFVVHSHPFFTELHERTVPLMSEVVGEPVEATYNFLSVYNSTGVCGVHMDSPRAKWTLDLCIDQSAPWPIHFSQVVSWPDPEVDTWGEDWEEKVKTSPSHTFTTFTLDPGQAVAFSGSSQWHYRDAMPAARGRSFCTLLFFHFTPKGTADLVNSRNWARLFDVPELSEFV